MRFSTTLGAMCLSLLLAASVSAQSANSLLKLSEDVVSKSEHTVLASASGAIIQDPSFEGGRPPAQTTWTSTNTTYIGGSPILGPPAGGPDLGRTGSWYAVLGSSNDPINTDVQQMVTVAAGDYNLEFWMLMGDNAGSDSQMFVTFGGTELVRFDINDAPTFDSYALVSVPVSVATDGTYLLSFNQTKTATPLINFFIDDVSMSIPIDGPSLAITPGSVDFGAIAAGSTETQTLDIRNVGTESVTISSVALSGDATFTIDDSGTDLTLDAGESTSLDVSFSPTAAGNFSGEITIASNDPNSPAVISLVGNGGAPPPNDNFADATPITGNGTYTGTNAFATVEAAEPVPSCQSDQSASVYWSYTPAANGSVTIDLSGSDFDTVLTFHNADGSEIACDDDGGTGLRSRLANLTVEGATTYIIRIAGFGGAEGNISFDLTGGPELITTSYTGTIDSGLQFNRPTADGDGTAGSCSPRSSTTPFERVMMSVNADGPYDLTATWPGYDGYLLLYEGSFDPASSCVNLIGRDDDFNGAGASQIAGAELTSGASYMLVFTTFSAATAGDFSIDMLGPGAATMVEDTATEEVVSQTSFLSAPQPNPASGATQVSLTMDAPQNVAVVVYDLLGRKVAVVHDGALAASDNHTFEVQVNALPAGQYIVRAQGETFVSTQRLTVVR